MRYVIYCTVFLIILNNCTTIDVARETGKVIKSIDKTFQISNIKKNEEKKLAAQKKLTKINILGKNENQLISLLGKPDLIRIDRNTYSMRFDKKECITYAFFNKQANIPKVEYFELRNKKGELIRNKKDINNCFLKTS